MPDPEFLPKPRLALQLGITGHRVNKLGPGGTAALEPALRAVYAAVEAGLASILKDAEDFYAPQPPLIRMVSALADGADRVAVTAAPQGWPVEAILPMPRDEYARDFEKASAAEYSNLLAHAQTVTELPLLNGADKDSTAGRARQYSALGEFLVSQVDVLIAVWDGQPADGPGGTGAVVALAIEKGRPVIHIDPASPNAPVLLNEGQSDRAADAATIGAVLHAVLMPPAAAASGDHRHATHTAAPVLPAYFNRTWPGPLYFAFGYNLLRKICGVGRFSWPLTYPGKQSALGAWDSFFAVFTDHDGGMNTEVRNGLLTRSAFADAFAWRYAHLYRSAYVAIFILAALAVPVGLGYLFLLDSPAVLDIKAGFVLLELAIIAVVLVVVRRGVRGHWHGLWMETRELAELLRLGRSLAYAGGVRDFIEPPGTGGSESFPAWYARATFREIGLPNAVLDGVFLTRVLDATAIEVAEQRAYHTANARNLHILHHKLHKTGDLCFVLTVAALLAYLAVWGADRLIPVAHAASPTPEGAQAAHHGPFHDFLHYYLKPVVSIAAAGLPAIGAALAGLRAQGDFEGFAHRSLTTGRELEHVARQIAALRASAGGPDLARTSDTLLLAARVMSSDVSNWRQLFASKRLTLPA